MSVVGSLRQCGRGALHARAAFAGGYISRFQSNKTGDSEDCNQLLKHLVMKIKATGPITVAEYMKEVLTNPIKGYYMHHDMLGEHGDFITSPEISQVFGELIAVWCINEWISGGKSKSLKLVELGPGKGSLMDDILRVFSQFQHLLQSCDISIHLVEVSPKLSEIQAIRLMGNNVEVEYDENTLAYKKGVTKSGLPISWYQDVRDVPAGYTFFLAHEFFDALPIHKLQGFRAHQLHNVLKDPGTADLTADVDFSFLKRIVGNSVVSLGPIEQQEFLKNMGIDLRMKVLLENNKDVTTQQHLIRSYDVLMNPCKMGQRFKFFSLIPHSRLERSRSSTVDILPVAGFTQ
ncbi:protein arginine methyltransferase NDUFAF7, mitochondrial isoform X4 [Phyllobates terribilis]|uniref:protein arginine methyltransferase NDUFAF7, mitochondrial isoform X4 n=1 Tax=Phyllobates terribilis TaxID=111132 RepID=UPI003CCAADF6